MTNIRISKQTHSELLQLKEQLNAPSIDTVIIHLLNINQKYESSTIVRVIK